MSSSFPYTTRDGKDAGHDLDLIMTVSRAIGDSLPAEARQELFNEDIEEAAMAAVAAYREYDIAQMKSKIERISREG